MYHWEQLNKTLDNNMSLFRHFNSTMIFLQSSFLTFLFHKLVSGSSSSCTYFLLKKLQWNISRSHQRHAFVDVGFHNPASFSPFHNIPLSMKSLFCFGFYLFVYFFNIHPKKTPLTPAVCNVIKELYFLTISSNLVSKRLVLWSLIKRSLVINGRLSVGQPALVRANH